MQMKIFANKGLPPDANTKKDHLGINPTLVPLSEQSVNVKLSIHGSGSRLSSSPNC
jgi:hypothetical protein